MKTKIPVGSKEAYVINYVISKEIIDDNRTHYEDASTGEISNYGISLKWLQSIRPAATAEDVRSMTKPEAFCLYLNEWYLRYSIDKIPNNKVAAKILDICVNCGPKTGIKILQKALNDPLEANDPELLEIDGVIGPKVVAAVIRELAQKDGEYGLLADIACLSDDHYRDIVKNNPKQSKNLAGWLKRAESLPA